MGRKIQFLHQVNIGLTLHWANQEKTFYISEKSSVMYKTKLEL